jgi:acetoacetate decarboxylase
MGARDGVDREGDGQARVHDQDHFPHVDCTPRICELVRYYMEDVKLKGAWSGPAALQLISHAMCDVARLPVREVVSASHYIADLTLGLGEVIHDYLA